MNEVKFLTKQFVFRVISLFIYTGFLMSVIAIALVVMQGLSILNVSEAIRILNDIFWLIVLAVCGVIGFKMIMRIENKIAAENLKQLESNARDNNTSTN